MKRFRKVYLEITNICNKACSFCVQSTREKKFITLQEARARLAQVAQVSDYVYLHVLGEPLLHPQFADILQECANHKLAVNLVTNGTLLEKQMDTLLAAPALRQVSVSLHDAQNIAEAKQTLAAAHTLAQRRAAGKPWVELRLWNQQQGAEAAFFDTITAEICALWQLAQGAAMAPTRRGVPIAEAVSVHISTPFVWPSLAAPFVSDTGFCMGLRDQVAVLSNGTVVPCCLDSEGDAALGNLDEQSFDVILRGYTATTFYDQFSAHRCTQELCKHCAFRTRFDA